MKHDQRRCTTCRDYAHHQKATRGPGNWVAKLGIIHWCRSYRDIGITGCGRRRIPGKTYWTHEAGQATCRSCRGAAARARRLARLELARTR